MLDWQKNIVDMLNELFKTDPGAIEALIMLRVPTNTAMLEHPTAQVTCSNAGGDFPKIGLLGVLNAITATHGKIVQAVYDEDNNTLQGFRLVSGIV